MADVDAVLLHGKPLESCKVRDLKDELKRRGLSCTGAKATLRDRLKEVLSREVDGNEIVSSTVSLAAEAGEEKTVDGDDHVDTGQHEVPQDTKQTDQIRTTGIGNGTEQTDEIDKKGVSCSSVVEKEEEKEEREVNQSDSVGDHAEEMDNSGEEGKARLSVPDQRIKGPRSPGADASEIAMETMIVQPGARKRRLVIHKSSKRDTDHTVEMPKKKRAWGVSNTDKPQVASVQISTDSLKEIIPDDVASAVEKVADGEESDTSNDAEDNDNRRSREGAGARRSLSQGDVDVSERPSRQKISLRQQRLSGSAPGAARIAARGITEAIASTQDVNRTRRTPSPARNPLSCILHVTNLVRPFSLPQIKEFLTQKGQLENDGFWIDKIKSHCYAMYTNQEEAQAMREVMHGLKWPITSPKFLSVDFATREELNRAMGIADTPTVPPPVTITEESSKDTKGGLAETSPVVPNMTDTQRQVVEETEAPRPDSASAAKLLDNLFRKTKTQPAIYWIPLTDEQVLLRNKKRKEEEARVQRLREERQREREKERENERVEQQSRRNRNREGDRDRRDHQTRSGTFDRDRRRSRSRSNDRSRRR